MSGRSDLPSTPLLSLPCTTIVYRLITKVSWIDPDSHQVQGAAFQRRPDEDGLSVFITDRCSLDEAINSLGRVRAVATLHVGRIRNLGLNVVPDLDDARHAEIVNMPLESEDPDQASHLAQLLAEQSRIIWTR
jgi:hypothetical protein